MAGSLSVPTGTFAGRYTIERELGRGATATVYLARDTQRGRSVAIKVLRPELAQSVGADRFLREIKISEKLHHPHIVPVLDSGEADGQLYFVLPHMEEGSLRQLLQREKQLPIETALGIARTIAEALDYAHKRGLIHRDVKPENILFTSGQACLADFGIARAIERAIDESTTSTGLVRGTPAYMSPEQASGSTTYDGRTDVYSLALVLYEMLAGVPAFIGPTPESVIAMRFQHKPRELRVYRPSAAPALQGVIDKALQLAAADRYATAGDFAAALEVVPDGPIIASRTSGAAVRLRIPSRMASIGGAILAVFVLASGAFYVKAAVAGIPADTTRYAIVSANDTSAVAREAGVIFHRELSRWKGISVASPFEVQSLFPSENGPPSDREIARKARRNGFGRIIRIRTGRAGEQPNVMAALFDTDSSPAIAQASTSWSGPVTAAGKDFEKLVAKLLLRAPADFEAPGTLVLPAAQLYREARKAVIGFDLSTADSLFIGALTRDPDFADAAFWLGRIRIWQEQSRSEWLPWIQRAIAAGRLDTIHATVSAAFLKFDDRNADSTCDTLGMLAKARDSDIALWYDYATCLRSDKAVVRDSRSISGWRFRSSYHAAVQAYARAFELAPALHLTYQAGGFERLRQLLFLQPTTLRRGYAVPPDTGSFLAEATWRGDSLLMIPYPPSERLFYPTDSAGRLRAVVNQRIVFRRIARAWSVGLPSNAATKEAVAISLEMLGDPSALDTLRLSRRLVIDTGYAFRLAVDEVLMLISFGRDRPEYLDRAVVLGDSLIREHQGDASRDALLQPVAAFLGRCGLASSLAARRADAAIAERLDIPLPVVAAADSLTVLFALGCVPSGGGGLDNVERAIETAASGRSPEQSRRVMFELLGRAVRFGHAADTLRLRRYAESGDPLVQAKLAAARGDRSTVHKVLTRLWSRASHGSALRSPDSVLIEALLLLETGDTATAIGWIDPVLNRPGWLDVTLDRPVESASLVRLAFLRARLSARHSPEHLRWLDFGRTLSRGAEGILSGRGNDRPAADVSP